jgi:hypothetical protein
MLRRETTARLAPDASMLAFNMRQLAKVRAIGYLFRLSRL